MIPGSSLLPPCGWLLPPHPAGHNLHTLSSIHQLPSAPQCSVPVAVSPRVVLACAPGAEGGWAVIGQHLEGGPATRNHASAVEWFSLGVFKQRYVLGKP